MSELAGENDYILNHDVVERFPFSLYHRPIRDAVLKLIFEQAGQTPSLRILSVGCGLSHILKQIPRNHSYRGVDVDPRVINACQSLYSDRKAEFSVSEPYTLPVPDSSYDVVFATEVVEHVLEPERWLKELVSKLDKGGAIQLSTPNYGGWLLPTIEQTFLEWMARRQGFTRKGIHPTPFNSKKLHQLLERGGLKDITVRKTPFNLALVGTGYRA